MTIRALEKEVLDLPPRSRFRFAQRILESLGDFMIDDDIENAWDQEIGRRVNEIESGKVKGVPAAQAMAKARRALNETVNFRLRAESPKCDSPRQAQRNPGFGRK